MQSKASIENKIARIKAALAADKRKWGGFYDDSRGLRYLPPRHYIELEDYSGGLRYMRWFRKNFSDDCGFPDFLFEWSVILFMNGKLREAGQKIFETFRSNTYVLDKFFDRLVVQLDKWEGSSSEKPDFALLDFHYSHSQQNLAGFAEWLEAFTATDRFTEACAAFIDIQRQLKTEMDIAKRRDLIEKEKGLTELF